MCSLFVNDHLIPEKQSAAGCRARRLADTSSCYYTSQFQKVRRTADSEPFNFKSNNTEDYSRPFPTVELKQALRKSNYPAAGPDKVHYILLTHLPESVLSILLKVSHSVSESGTFFLQEGKRSWFPYPGQAQITGIQ